MQMYRVTYINSGGKRRTETMDRAKLLRYQSLQANGIRVTSYRKVESNA